MRKGYKLCVLAMCGFFALSAVSCSKKVEDTVGDRREYPVGEVSYPIKTDVTLDIWMNMNSVAASLVGTMTELPFINDLITRTGIGINYIHPPAGQANEKFNLMLSTGDLPDIVIQSIEGQKEGVEGLIQGGYVTELTEEFLKNYAPNFKNKVDSDNQLKKAIRTAEGRYYGFPTVLGDESMTASMGLIIRDDWLRDLNLEMPETIDEWYRVLKAFKEQKGADSPLTFETYDLLNRASAFLGAYGVRYGFYNDNGKIKYGMIEDGFKKFLTEFSRWYKEGLIDANFVSIVSDSVSAKMLNGKSGATIGYNGSAMGTWLESKKGEDYSLAPAPYPSLEKGTVCEFGITGSVYSTPIVWISGISKHKELAARLLDYSWTEEGHAFFNFGTEGLSYNMVDNSPVYTDLILNNPNGLSSTQALTKYTHYAYVNGLPYEQDVRGWKQRYPSEKQKQAIDVWSKSNNSDHVVLGSGFIPNDERTDISFIMADINTYVTEKTAQFIMGLEPLEKIDQFMARIKELQIERVIEIYQKYHDKYVNE